ncbi:hypothetical protein [Helicobacter sp. 23-1045]
MKYSFTHPLPKSIISHQTKIWIFYIAISVGIIYGYGVYLDYQIKTIKSHAQLSNTQIDGQDESISALNNTLNKMRTEIKLEAQNLAHNKDLSDALIKIFDLVPNQITINFMRLDENSLMLKGTTPTREAYSFLLEAPLRAVFDTTRADFYALPNGWFNFTSISKNQSNLGAR